MTRDHKIAVFLLATIVALYPWAMNEHGSHPKKFSDLKKEIIDLEYVELKKEKSTQDYNDATKPGPTSGGYDSWESSVIPKQEGRVYDCGMAEWHPDIPNKVKEECRKIRAENTKN